MRRVPLALLAMTVVALLAACAGVPNTASPPSRHGGTVPADDSAPSGNDTDTNPQRPSAAPEPTGTLYFSHAGDVYAYTFSDDQVSLLFERDGRRGAHFAPDGGLASSDHREPGGDTRVTIRTLPDGAAVTDLLFGAPLVQEDLGVSLSPGAQLLAAVVHDWPSEPQLRVTDRSGRLVYASDPSVQVIGHGWTPDGALLFTAWDASGAATGHLWRLADPASGSAPERLSQIGVDRAIDLPRQVAVSPDSERVAYSVNGAIVVGALEAGATHTVAIEAAASLARPAFSPDGQYLAVVMLGGPTSMRGSIHVLPVPPSGSVRLEPDGATALPGPNQGQVWSSGADSSLGWFTD